MNLVWRIRSRLSSDARRRIRAATDPFVGPFGSIRGAKTDEPIMALTFDDGPDPESTPRLLDVLDCHGTKATFFVIVDRAERNHKILERIITTGHEVALHGLDHRRLTQLSRRDLLAHMVAGVGRLSALTGSAPRWFRPPYGSQNLSSFVAARRLGMKVVVWSADCADWETRNEADIATLAIARATPGGILLLHDCLADSETQDIANPGLDRARALAMVLRGLTDRGFRGVTVGELVDGRTAHHTAWFRA